MTGNTPSWRRRWGPLGKARERALQLKKPVPVLFETFYDRLWAKRMEHARKIGARKQRPYPKKPEVLEKMRMRDLLARLRSIKPAKKRVPKYNMADDMANSEAVLSFVASRDNARALYAALCNVIWMRNRVTWSISWRGAGRLVADLRAQGEHYMDFFLSGNEGQIDPNVRVLLAMIGWSPQAPKP